MTHIVLTKGHQRSTQEINGVRELRDQSPDLSLRELGKLFPGNGISREGVRKILKKTGETPRRSRSINLEHVTQMLHLIHNDESITSFWAVGEKTKLNTKPLKLFLKNSGRFREIVNLLDRRRAGVEKKRVFDRRDSSVRELQIWSVKVGHNISATELYDLDPPLYSRIERSGGIEHYREMSGLPKEVNAPLSESFVEMIVGRIEFK
jgi:hypothetical protein